MKFRYLDRTSNRLLFFANMPMCGSMVMIRTHNNTMMTTVKMSVEFSTDLRLSKMKRGSYAGWKRREAEAKRRAEDMKRKHRV